VRDKVEEDFREKGWRTEEALDRRVWRGRIKEGNAVKVEEEEKKKIVRSAF
jgi:hypothetical protein